MTEHMYTYKDPSSAKDLERICALLGNDGIIAYPTDLSWAFACDAASSRGMDRIRALKPHKAKEQPFSLVCRDIAMASGLTVIDNFAYSYLKRALPGPYTILLERNRSLPRQLKDKRRAVGIRIPDSTFVLDLVDHFGRALATTSVPHTEEDEPFHFGYQVAEEYGHALDLVVDLGEELLGLETTVVDMTEGQIKIVRQGAGDANIFAV